jgi:hypothetical protein
MVVPAVTARMSKGQPVTILVEVEEDLTNEHPSDQWALSKVGEKYYAGQVKTRNQRAGMLERGIRFHLLHDKQCAKNVAHNRTR